MLKREKITSTAWILLMVILNFLIVLLMGTALLGDAESITEFMAMLENPALLAMVGPLYSMDFATMGALYTLMMLVFMGITIGAMNIFLVVRHTRADEEAGRYEVLRSLPCGRLATVNAAMLTAVIVNVISAVLFGFTMWLAMHIVGDPMGFESAMLWGVGLGAVGLAFAGAAALFSQLSSNSRGATGFSFMIMGLFYFLRAGADASPDSVGFLAFLGPLGILSRTWAYVHDYWWPVLLILAFAAVFTALAYWICSFRDIDQGIVPARPGKASGGLLMKSTFGLNFRLLRTSIIVWIIILFVTGLSYSIVLSDIDTFIAGNDFYRGLLLGPTGLLDLIDADAPVEVIAEQINSVLNAAGLSIVQMFSNMIGFMMAMISAIPVIMFITKAKGEEKAIRAELLFATPTSKVKYLLGLVIFAFIMAPLLQSAQAIGLYSVARTAIENPADLPFSFLMRSSLVYVPAIWVIGGITVLLVGLFPRRTGFIWAYYGFTFFAMMYGRMLPEIAWIANLTPLGFVPQLPLDEIVPWVLVVKVVIAFALVVLGLFFYRKRDINVVK